MQGSATKSVTHLQDQLARRYGAMGWLLARGVGFVYRTGFVLIASALAGWALFGSIPVFIVAAEAMGPPSTAGLLVGAAAAIANLSVGGLLFYKVIDAFVIQEDRSVFGRARFAQEASDAEQGGLK